LRILVVDREFLVAMEVETVLTEALACEVKIATPRTYAMDLEQGLFDVVVIDTVLVRGESEDAALRLRACGAGLVFTTLSVEDMDGLKGWDGIAVVAKPFDDHHLVDAVKNAARM
jgi:DNA-binding response OmpR family regulator